MAVISIFYEAIRTMAPGTWKSSIHLIVCLKTRKVVIPFPPQTSIKALMSKSVTDGLPPRDYQIPRREPGADRSALTTLGPKVLLPNVMWPPLLWHIWDRIINK